MKKYIFLIRSFFIMFLFYLMGSFVFMDFNPNIWTKEARMVYSILGVPVSFLISCFSMINDNE